MPLLRRAAVDYVPHAVLMLLEQYRLSVSYQVQQINKQTATDATKSTYSAHLIAAKIDISQSTLVFQVTKTLENNNSSRTIVFHDDQHNLLFCSCVENVAKGLQRKIQTLFWFLRAALFVS